VCPEARVKFENINFWTEADFACYCSWTSDGTNSATDLPTLPAAPLMHAELGVIALG
jgi:hypothetical protein